MNAFADMRLRYSMTVSIINTRDQMYLGPRWNEETGGYELYGDFPSRTPETLFELIDAGTMDNIPANTRPRGADLFDANTQKFYLRFNETLMLRSVSINKFLATQGTNFNSDLFFSDDATVSEKFRARPPTPPSPLHQSLLFVVRGVCQNATGSVLCHDVHCVVLGCRCCQPFGLWCPTSNLCRPTTTKMTSPHI